MRLRDALPLLAIVLFTLAPSQTTHMSHEQLGEVNFVTSCDPAVKPQFNQAIALMHSFQFGRATDSLHTILKTDPSCSIAYWGIAVSAWGNPFISGIRTQAQLATGRHAVEQAQATPAKTARERAYIHAIAHLYTDASDQQSRMLAYEQSMATLHTSYPDDIEAAIFYALSLAAAADPTDKTYARQLKAGAMLEDLFTRYPDHPGLAHYIIHTYDVPSLAPRAALAAQRYSQIAPSTPHALHMPSHTFTRLGDWQASIRANQASAVSARAANQPAEELHATDYMVYAYLQLAQDAAARNLVQSTEQIFSRVNATNISTGAANAAAAYFARAAIPARYCLERHAWAEAVALQPHPTEYPYTDAITYFARGLGAAHLHDVSTARASLDSLAKIRDHPAQAKHLY